METISINKNKVLSKEVILTQKIEKLKFEKQLIILYNQIQKIETKLGEKSATNYLKGYLEDHGIPMDVFLNTINNI